MTQKCNYLAAESIPIAVVFDYTERMAKDVRFGIIGLGNMGRSHARLILDGKVPGLRLVAVADVQAAAAEAFPEISYFDSGKALIDSGTVEAVLIATPHFDHTALGIAALEAGLHVLVEKPISVHKADCERLIASHRDKSKVFAAMFNQRTDPKYRKLKQLIDSGEIGKITRIQWTITDWFRTDHYYASGGWRATWAGEGGGVLLNQSPHQLDLWQWLFGMPDKVWADCQIGRFHDIEVEDDVTAVMKYNDGKRGVFLTTTGEAPGTNRLEVASERGRLVLEGDTINWIRNEIPTRQFQAEATSSFSKPDSWQIEIPFSGTGEQHLGVMKNFARAVLEGEPLLAPAEEGIHSVELGNAMLLSGATESEVSMPLDAARYQDLLSKRIGQSRPKDKVAARPDKEEDLSQSF